MWIVLLITGLVLAIVTKNSIMKGRKSRSWPSVNATVIGSEVEVKHEYDKDGSHTYYYPRVYYQYSVDGEEFSGNKIKLLEASMTRRKAQAFIGNFLAGDQLPVFYNPEKHEESVILSGEQKYLYLFFAIGIALAIFSIYKLIV